MDTDHGNRSAKRPESVTRAEQERQQKQLLLSVGLKVLAYRDAGWSEAQITAEFERAYGPLPDGMIDKAAEYVKQKEGRRDLAARR